MGYQAIPRWNPNTRSQNLRVCPSRRFCFQAKLVAGSAVNDIETVAAGNAIIVKRAPLAAPDGANRGINLRADLRTACRRWQRSRGLAAALPAINDAVSLPLCGTSVRKCLALAIPLGTDRLVDAWTSHGPGRWPLINDDAACQSANGDSENTCFPDHLFSTA